MSSAKRGLGKGLAALIPETEISPGEQATEVAVSAIEPNPDQPRRQVDPTSLSELAESIREHGIIQPLIVRRHGPKYQIIAGERRWRAAQQVGLKRVPVVMRDIDDRRLTEIALVENLQREDLNPVDEALALQELLKLDDSQETVARKVGKSRPYVANSVRLLQLHPDVRAEVKSGRLSAGHARALLGLAERQQPAAAHEVLRRHLTVRQTESLVRRLGLRPGETVRSRSAFEEWESRLREVLEAKVQITGSARRGQVVITFSGEDELERIIGRLIDSD